MAQLTHDRLTQKCGFNKIYFATAVVVIDVVPKYPDTFQQMNTDSRHEIILFGGRRYSTLTELT